MAAICNNIQVKHKQMTIVTMFTDASYKAEDKLASWAAWAKINGQTYRYSGLLKNSIDHADEAELSAIANGLAKLRGQKLLQRHDIIIIQSDSKTALTALSKRQGRTEYNRQVIKFIDQLYTDLHLRFSLRHVKAHKGSMSPRHAVNSWCDRECKRVLRQALLCRKQMSHMSSEQFALDFHNTRTEDNVLVSETPTG